MRAIIIEDEYQPREVLIQKLGTHCPDVKVVGFADNITDGYNLYQAEQPEVVFLDITLPNGTGFDFINKFEAIPFEIIFCTAHPEFAIEAFKFSALGYLLKPVNTEELVAVVKQAQSNLLLKDTFLRYQTFLGNFQSKNTSSPNIVIPSSERYEVVKVSDIMYLEGSEKYTYVFVSDGRKILSSNNIGKFKNMLSEYQFFVNHKSYIVNLDIVKTITNDDEIILKDGTKLPLARRRRAEFLQIISTR